MTGFLFAGQGSQYIGMGKGLYEAFSSSKAVFDRADSALGFSLSKLCFQGPQEELTKTNNAQPAILTMSIAAWEAFRVHSSQFTADSKDYAAGLSLGEYSALVAAEALGFEDAVRLVRRRGELMEEAAQATPGAMLSIIGLDLAKVRELCSQTNTEVANINCPGQVVISGGVNEIQEAQLKAQEAGANMAIRLEVSGAFHSSFMKAVSLKFAAELAKVKINSPKLSLISNVTAKPVASSQEIRDNLIKQIASSVLWEPSMRYMLSKGIKEFVEFGPGKVLRGLMRRIDAGVQVVNIEKKEDILCLGQGGSKDAA